MVNIVYIWGQSIPLEDCFRLKQILHTNTEEMPSLAAFHLGLHCLAKKCLTQFPKLYKLQLDQTCFQCI